MRVPPADNEEWVPDNLCSSSSSSRGSSIEVVVVVVVVVTDNLGHCKVPYGMIKMGI